MYRAHPCARTRSLAYTFKRTYLLRLHLLRSLTLTRFSLGLQLAFFLTRAHNLHRPDIGAAAADDDDWDEDDVDDEPDSTVPKWKRDKIAREEVGVLKPPFFHSEARFLSLARRWVS
jgi:hypothetical protein